MMMLFGALAALAVQTAPPADAAWTWTLYSGEGPVVLANEVPDTPHLRATLQCERGAGAAKLSLYGGGVADGFATVSAGEASATTEARSARGGGLEAAIRIDHPVFAAFVQTGALSVALGEQRRAVTIEPAHLAKLRRFAELCGG
jgi:hypothetical protein